MHRGPVTSLRIGKIVPSKICGQRFLTDFAEFFKSLGDGNRHDCIVSVAPGRRRNGPLRNQRPRDFGVKKKPFAESIAAAESLQAMRGASQTFLRVL